MAVGTLNVQCGMFRRAASQFHKFGHFESRNALGPQPSRYVYQTGGMKVKTFRKWHISFALTLTVLTGSVVPAFGEGGVRMDEVQSAGVLTFAPDGTLFVGDNVLGAVFAYRTGQPQLEPVSPDSPPLEIDSVDWRIAKALHVSGQLHINGMAVHPTSKEIFISFSETKKNVTIPMIAKISRHGSISAFDLKNSEHSEFKINDAPAPDQHFTDRAGQWPVPAPEKYHDKAMTPMRSMTIVDLRFHNGELYIAGISNEEFSSILRRVPYPFTGGMAETHVKIFHDAHAEYETRAPIRAMTFEAVDGKDTLVAAYACSPLVLIPVADLKDGAHVEGHVIGDMGNGQPLSMFSFTYNGQPAIFVTNAGHDPRIILVSSLQNARIYTEADSNGQMKMDTGDLPQGVVGKSVMFVGSSLHAASLDGKFIISHTRDAGTGKLNLESLPAFPLPMHLDTIWVEFDFPNVPFPPAAPKR
jgi:hypothetical protein